MTRPHQGVAAIARPLLRITDAAVRIASGDRSRRAPVATDDESFHHLAAGLVGSFRQGLSLVAVGYSGRVFVIHYGP